MALSDQEKVGLSPEEVEALEAELSDDEKALEAASKDDDDEETAPAAADTKAEETDSAAATVEDEDGSAATDEAAAADAAASDDATSSEITPPFSASLPVNAVADYEAKRGNLLDERKELRQKYRDGEIDADDYDTQLDTINDNLAKLDREHDQAEFAAQANANIAQAQYVWTINQFKAEVKRSEGIDYDVNKGLLNAWDLKVKELAQDEANSDKTVDWFLREAHKQVMSEVKAAAAALGLAPKETKEEKDAKSSEQKKIIDTKVKDAISARKPDTSKAKSLATVPAAESTVEAEGEFAHLDGLSGLALEKAVAKMSPEQQERWANS